ncbi:MAG TPA: shikimate dehydrogenase [Coriobacteriia bacterium]|nr:shikimate dehydrogenase [Coriobacteriia bacterium]
MRPISGSTRLAGVVGTPLAHSLSPAMHNAAYEHMELDWVYVPFDVSDEVGLRRLVAAVRSLDFVGFNVTMPYKQAMLELCDEVAAAASMAGAVNTVHCVDGRLVGYNTDGRGLLEALELECDFVPADKDVVVVGAGGAAGAALVALILGRARSVTVVAREISRGQELVERMSEHAGSVTLRARDMASAGELVAAAQLVVNATPVGMRAGDPSPLNTDWLRSGQVVYDMVYGTPIPTALVRAGEAAGAKTADGLGMLVCQGATAVDIWLGEGTAAPRDVMRAAAKAALDTRRATG